MNRPSVLCCPLTFKCKCLLAQVFGQVYIPVVNYVLMALTMIVVGIFQTSDRLGNAYGSPNLFCLQ